MITLTLLFVFGIIALVLFVVGTVLLGLPLLILFSLAPMFLAAAGVVLLVKALLEHTSLNTALTVLVIAAVLFWFF